MTFTQRQNQIIQLVVDGKSNKAIAKELALSIKTVEVYVQRIAVRIDGDGKPRIKIIRWHYSRAA